MKVEYFTIDGAPGKYFMCAPYKASLSVTGCAGLYKAEKGVHAGNHMHCRGCPIGAHHAGEAPVSAPGLFGSLICPRCHRGSTRLVRGVCMSCVNRQYETVRGVNARGRPPSRLTPLAPMSMTVMEDGRVVVIDVDLSSGHIEVILRALRSRPAARSFGRRSSFANAIERHAGAIFAPRRVCV